MKHWSTIDPGRRTARRGGLAPDSVVLAGLALIGAVLAAVHHAEVVAHISSSC